MHSIFNKSLSILFTKLIFLTSFLVASDPFFPDVEDYHCLGCLGSGDTAIVYLAQLHGKLLAIKCFYTECELAKIDEKSLHEQFAEDSVALKAQEEFLISHDLNHPNILKIHQLMLGKSKDGSSRTFLVMDYISGNNLDNTDCVTIKHFQQVLEALLFAFQKGYVHVDLIEENFILENSQVIFIDLGSFLSIDQLKNGLSLGKYLQSLSSFYKLLLLKSDYDLKFPLLAYIEKELSLKQLNCNLSTETLQILIDFNLKILSYLKN